MIDSDDFLRTELRQALDSRRPDRTAMLNRIAANRAAGDRPRGRVLRLAGSAVAVLAVLGVGGAAKWALADDHGPRPVLSTPAPPSPSPAHSPTPSASLGGAAVVPSSPPPPTPASSSPPAPPPSAPPSPSGRVRGHPGDTQVVKGSLSSTSAVAAGTGGTVTLEPHADLTELTLTIRVTATAGLTDAGGTDDVPDDAITRTTEKRDGAVLYHFTLKPGRTLTAGTYTFTARYGGGDRDAADDTYEAFATSVEHKRIHIYGNFLPRD